MAAKWLYRILALAGLLPGLAACVYPFEADIEGADTRLAIDGSVHIGEVSYFTLSRVVPLSGQAANTSYDWVALPEMQPVRFEAYIEGEDGVRTHGVTEGPNTISFDTSGLSDGQRYRTHFKDLSDGYEYESDWLEVHPAPVIDALTYTADKEEGVLRIALSMHASGSHLFRWYYDETWEYHADMRSRYYYDPARAHAMGSYRPLDGIVYMDNANTYYCWREYTSPAIRIFSTADQTEDRFVDLNFHQVDHKDQRLQMLYRLTVHLEAIDEQTYKYWHNIEQNTQNQGSLFAPMPSQMSGNIRCLTDPSVQVLGQMSAAKAATAELFYDNEVEHFYQPEHATIEVTYANPLDFDQLSSSGYEIYDVNFGSEAEPPSYQWLPRRCVDCRVLGGTKNKPAGWPNNHY